MTNGAEVLARLAEDRPLFHHADPATAQIASSAGVAIPSGDFSMAVTPGALRWIADRLTGDMVTIETGAGYTTVLFAAVSRHHYCCNYAQHETDKIRAYLERHGVPADKVTFLMGTSDDLLPRLEIGKEIDFAYIDGCHGYPFPALDWHYIDRHLKVGGLLGMDNAELRPVREHCQFLEENGSYRRVGAVYEGVFVWFYEKLMDQGREWIVQDYSRAKKDPGDHRLPTRIRRKFSKLIKPYLY